MSCKYDHRPLKNDVDLGGCFESSAPASIFVCVVVVEGSVHIEKRLNNLWGVQKSSSSLSIRVMSNIGLSIIKKFLSINKNLPIAPKKKTKLPLTPHGVLVLLINLLMMTLMDMVDRQQIDPAVNYFTAATAQKDEDSGENGGDD